MTLFSEKLARFTAAHPCEAVSIGGASFRIVHRSSLLLYPPDPFSAEGASIML